MLGLNRDRRAAEALRSEVARLTQAMQALHDRVARAEAEQAGMALSVFEARDAARSVAEQLAVMATGQARAEGTNTARDRRVEDMADDLEQLRLRLAALAVNLDRRCDSAEKALTVLASRREGDRAVPRP